jgi:plasmid replication initiation protein
MKKVQITESQLKGLVRRMINEENKYTAAKDFLKSQGFVVVNFDIWDVKGMFNVDDEKAHQILEKAVNNLTKWEILKKEISRVATNDFGIKSDNNNYFPTLGNN